MCIRDSLQGTRPDIPESYRTAVPPKRQRTFGQLLLIFRDDSVAGFAMNFFIVLHENAIMKDSNSGRLQQLVSVEFRRLQNDIESLPFPGRTRDIHQGRRLAVNGSALAIGIE